MVAVFALISSWSASFDGIQVLISTAHGELKAHVAQVML